MKSGEIYVSSRIMGWNVPEIVEQGTRANAGHASAAYVRWYYSVRLDRLSDGFKIMSFIS